MLESNHARRPDVLAVHSLDHFSFAVPDLAEAQQFYRDFGLHAEADGADLALSAVALPHRWGRLTPGPRKRLGYLSFGVFADDLPVFADRLRARGLLRSAPPQAEPGVDSLWLTDPDGTAVELRIAGKSSPDRKAGAVPRPAATAHRAAPLRGAAAPVQPRRLSHVLLFSPDVPRAARFYVEVLGLRLSDSAGDVIAFLHGAHGSDHHLIAFAKSEAPGFHHCSWDVGAIDDIGLGAMAMAEKGHRAGWGLGRHVLGSNYFHYVRDPWGSYSEYSFGIDHVGADCDWPAADHPVENSFYLWGPEPPPEFVRNLEAV